MAHICSDWLDMSLILNQIPPTKHKLRVTIKIEDIIVPTFRGTGDEICYLSNNFQPWKILRYTKGTCNLTQFHIMAS
jgi:hypothetical protein